jgi:hypothetical protein
MGIFSLALVYGIKQWRWKEAEVLMVQVIEGRESLFGPENATTLLAKANFAKILVGQGRWVEAEQLLVKVTDAKKRVLGQGHLHTLSSMGWLGATYVLRGRIDKATFTIAQAVILLFFVTLLGWHYGFNRCLKHLVKVE